MPAKKPRRIIKGIEYIQCSVATCGKWVRFEEATKNRSYRCQECNKEYKANWARNQKHKKHTRHGTRGNKGQEKIRKKELRGELPIKGGLYATCEKEMISILESEDVEALLRYESNKERENIDKHNFDLVD